MTAPKDSGYLIPVERLDRAILMVRGQRVMLDADLAALFGVSTRALNQAIKRNLDRFPADFLFRLNPEENRVGGDFAATPSHTTGRALLHPAVRRDSRN